MTETKKRSWFKINRAPVLILWAAVVAEQLGYHREEALTQLARSLSLSELALRGYELYEAFRPEIPPGKKGWGAAGRLDLDRIRAMSRRQPLQRLIHHSARSSQYACHTYQEWTDARLHVSGQESKQGDIDYIEMLHNSRRKQA